MSVHSSRLAIAMLPPKKSVSRPWFIEACVSQTELGTRVGREEQRPLCFRKRWA